MRLKRTRSFGFTFMEIMLVVVIIGLLASLVAPRILQKLKKANINATMGQMANIKTALALYFTDMGKFPNTSQGMQALLAVPSGVSETKWDGPYLEGMPEDSWKQKFTYKSPGDHKKDYDLYSSGPDEAFDTEDDIKNWSDEEAF